MGEHKINVNYGQVPVTGSPYSCKVYDVNAIRVKPVDRGIVGHPVTFIGECFCILRNFEFFYFKKKNNNNKSDTLIDIQISDTHHYFNCIDIPEGP